MIDKNKISDGQSPSAGPVEKQFHIRIDSDGNWYHEGGRIKREALVRLFSTVLSCDDRGVYWLRTPVEFGRITVEDAPFVIVSANRTGAGRAAQVDLQDNIGRVHRLSPQRPLVFRARRDGRALQPYLLLGQGLTAKLSRPVYYQLAEWALEADTGAKIDKGAGLWSAGHFFTLTDEPED